MTQCNQNDKSKDKERILKATKEKIAYKGIPIRLSADLSIVQNGVAQYT